MITLSFNHVTPINLDVSIDDFTIISNGLLEPLTFRECLQRLVSWELPLLNTVLMVPWQTTDFAEDICTSSVTDYSTLNGPAFYYANLCTYIVLVADGPHSQENSSRPLVIPLIEIG